MAQFTNYVARPSEYMLREPRTTCVQWLLTVVFAHALLIHADIPISEIRSTDIAKWINLLHDIGKSKRFTDIGNSNLRYQMIIPISVNTNDFPIYDN